MFGKRIPLMRVAGLQVSIDPSWIFLMVLVSWSLASGAFPAGFPELEPWAWWLMGIASAMGLVLSILIHELSHSLVARREGLPVHGITLFLFGGVSETGEEPDQPGKELKIAVVGPLTSLVLGVLLSAAVALGSSLGVHVAILGVTSYLSVMNFALGFFNLIPAFPLDGGRVLRSALWRWKKDFLGATRIACRSGVFLGLVLMGFGLLNALQGAVLGGIWLLLIGVFLRGAAETSYRQALLRITLEGENVGRFLSKDPLAVSPALPLSDFFQDYVIPHRHGSYPVVDGARLLGQVRTEDLKQSARRQWDFRQVRDLMVACPDDLVVSPDLNARRALERMQRRNSPWLVVADAKKYLGVVLLGDMLTQTQLKWEFEDRDPMAA